LLGYGDRRKGERNKRADSDEEAVDQNNRNSPMADIARWVKISLGIKWGMSNGCILPSGRHEARRVYTRGAAMHNVPNKPIGGSTKAKPRERIHHVQENESGRRRFDRVTTPSESESEGWDARMKGCKREEKDGRGHDW